MSIDRVSLDMSLRASAAANQEPVIRPNNTAAEGVSPEYVAKVQEAAEKFEGFFIAHMLRQMRQTTREMSSEDSVYNSRSNQEMLDMADVALADSLASQRAFGIADAIVKQLLPTGLKSGTPPVASSE
jgi:flagellar protein FlgJ